MVKYIRVALLSVLFGLGVVIHSFSVDAHSHYNGVYYSNFMCSDNVVLTDVDGLDIQFQGSLSNLGDSYSMMFDVTNDSSVDVIVQNYSYNDDDPFVFVQLSYADGSRIQQGDILKRGETKRLKYSVSYQKQVPSESYSFDSSFKIYYEQYL